ncbi:hypothetical protein TKK_0006396 [Trichogramma kaykai]
MKFVQTDDHPLIFNSHQSPTPTPEFILSTKEKYPFHLVGRGPNDLWYEEMKKVAYSIEGMLKQQLEIATENQIILKKILEVQCAVTTSTNENSTESKIINNGSREISKFERNLMVAEIRNILYSMKRLAKEKARDFIERFERLTNDFDKYNDSEMPDSEKAELFFHIVGDTCPLFKSTCNLSKSVTGTQMKYDDMRVCLLDIESEIYPNERPPKTHNSPERPSLAETKCHRCNVRGHWAGECPLANTDMYFCYKCKDIKKHKSDYCPKNTQQVVSESESDSDFTPNRRSSFRGRGRGRGRGKNMFRGKNRYNPFAK